MLSVECCRAKDLSHLWRRQREIKRRALPRLAGRPDFPTVALHDVFHDRQAKAGAALFAGTGFVDAVKSFEHALERFRRNARTVVAHANLDGAVAVAGGDRDISLHAAV